MIDQMNPASALSDEGTRNLEGISTGLVLTSVSPAVREGPAIGNVKGGENIHDSVVSVIEGCLEHRCEERTQPQKSFVQRIASTVLLLFRNFCRMLGDDAYDC